MDTYRLRYFCAIAETGSLTKASEVLGISHSGLSKAISVLEEETKLKLFRPQGRGLEITKDGKWLYQKAQEILKIENEISAGIKTETTSVRIGLSEVIATTCAGLIAREISEALKIIETDVGELESKILGGELDFGYVFSPAPKPELEYLEIGDVKFNSFAKADFLKERKIDEYFFVVPATNLPFNPLGYKIRDGWPQEIPRISKFAVSGFSIALDLLRAGESIVYMPNFVASLENERKTEGPSIVKVPHHREAESQRQLFLVKPKNVEETKEMKKVSKILRKICCS
jgi:DNA-binding transcriptional LysR family regulator